MENNVVAFDLGCTQIRVSACTFDDSTPNNDVRVLGNKSKDISGLLRRGKVVDEAKVAKIVSDFIAWAQSKFNSANSVKKFLVCANVEGLSFMGKRERVSVNISQRKIERTDLVNLMEEAKVRIENREGDNNAVVCLRPVWYSIDNEVNTLDVIGEQCSNTLYGSFVAGVVSRSTIQSINRLFVGSSKPKDYYPTASSKATFLTLPNINNDCFALVDFGAETMGVAVYDHGVLEMEVSFPFGSLAITKDIAAGLGVSLKDAEDIKQKVGIPPADKAKSTYKYTTEDGSEISFSGSKLAYIINARVEELAAYVLSILTKLGRGKVKSLVLTGGGSLLKGLEETMRKVLEIPTSVDQTKRSDMTAEEMISFACTIGMAMQTANNEKQQKNRDKKKPQSPAQQPVAETPSETPSQNETKGSEPVAPVKHDVKKTSLAGKLGGIFGKLFDSDGYENG